jgi:hypothetical protein
MSYIIKSGPGYFLYLKKYFSDNHLDMPYLTSNETEATRVNKVDAKEIISKLEALGWEAEIIKAKKGKDE